MPLPSARLVFSVLLVAAAAPAASAQTPERVAPGLSSPLLDNDLLFAQFTEFRNRTYFVDKRRGGLWVTDGTPAGTSQVEDIGGVSITAVAGGRLYFNVTAGAEAGLYVTDGSPGGATLLSRTQMQLTKIAPVPDGRVYYVGYLTASDAELWTTDGTAAGTHRVKDIVPGDGSSNPSDFVTFGNRLFFTALRVTTPNSPSTDRRLLWVTDGTEAGTVLLTPDNTRYTASHVDYSQVIFQDRLFFTYHDDTNGVELWTSDGTLAGTRLFKDLLPGASGGLPSSGWPRYMTVFGNAFLFFAYAPGSNALTLWRSDGTAAGTTSLRYMNPSVVQKGFTRFGDRMVFSASGASGEPRAVWATDGTAGGTVRLSAVGLDPTLLTASGSRLFFYAFDTSALGYEPWVTEAAVGSARPLGDLSPGTTNADIRGFSPLGGGAAAFVARVAPNDYRLFTSDGTAAGTVLSAPPGATVTVGALSIKGFSSNDVPAPLQASHGAIYFQARFFAEDPSLYRLGVPRPGTAGEDGPAQAAFAVRGVYPNPARDRVQVDVEVPAATSVRVEVYDVLGRCVRVAGGTEVAAGLHGLTLDTRTLAPGLYVVRVTAGTESSAHRITVVR